MSTIRVVNLQHTDATVPNIVLESDGTSVFASGITISGATTLTVSGTAEFASGTAAAPKLTFIDDNDTGIYSPAANNLGITTNGTAALTIDSSQNVGIGTTPATNRKVHIQSTGFTELLVEKSDATTAAIMLAVDAGVGSIYTRSTESNSTAIPLTFHTGNDERMRIDSSGKIQIGRTSPLLSTELTVGGDNGLTVGKTNGSRIGMFGSFNQDLLIIGTYDDYPVVFRQNNSEAMRIDSSGRLLVGASSAPGSSIASTALIQVQGRAGFSSDYSVINARAGYTPSGADAALGFLTFCDSNNNIGAWITAYSDGGGWTSGSNHRSRLMFATTANGASSPTERMRIDSSGNVGINEASPDTPLHVKSSSGVQLTLERTNTISDFGLKFTRGNRTDQGIFTDGAGIALRAVDAANGATQIRLAGNNTNANDYDRIEFTVEGSERMRIDSSGRLLVGTTAYAQSTTAAFKGGYGSTTNPGRIALLRQYSAISGNNLNAEVGRIIFADDNGNGDGAQIRAEIDGTSWSTTSKPTRFTFFTTASSSVSPTEQMRISNNGAFTSYTNGSFHGFKTNATSASSEFLRFQNNATSITTGTTVARVRADGDLENANNSYTGLSDVKLKENIVDASSQWEDIKALRVRNYNFKQDTGFGTHTQLGVIAQETETVSPGLVKEAPDLDNEGNDLGTTTKSVNYSVLYMKAVKALQEAMERIETLEASNAALEQRLTDAGL